MCFLTLLLVHCTSKEQIKREQYYVEGERLYGLYCANCHQPGGEGMANLYPPLHFPGDKARFIQIIKHGIDTEISVNGVTYHRPMPANPNLTELDIAEITTFIYNKWGKESTYTPIDTVKKALREFATSDRR
jgi:mono/diheme cytochrome c family protein